MRFNLTKNSVINYLMSFIQQPRTELNVPALIQEKIPKDHLFSIFGFLRPGEILILCQVSRTFDDFVKNYNNSFISLKDTKHQHNLTIQDFHEQKELLPETIERNSRRIDLLIRSMAFIALFGAIKLHITSSFKFIDQTEVFMRTSYHQFSCPNSEFVNLLENITDAEMILGVMIYYGKIFMTCGDSNRNEHKIKQCEEKVSQSAFHLRKRNEIFSRANPVYQVIDLASLELSSSQSASSPRNG